LGTEPLGQCPSMPPHANRRIHHHLPRPRIEQLEHVGSENGKVDRLWRWRIHDWLAVSRTRGTLGNDDFSRLTAGGKRQAGRPPNKKSRGSRNGTHGSTLSQPSSRAWKPRRSMENRQGAVGKP